ncbi:MAG: hypothetical protein GX815_12210 [Clostridiales bacterium]|nr:hypothetical protein [Clostridiales bacterium]
MAGISALCVVYIHEGYIWISKDKLILVVNDKLIFALKDKLILAVNASLYLH